ncbi:MAG: hypothetical protein HXY25_06950 [Alphaproteobacteria bacterium]|nr:hypothetical protein [Alphaproteobacteria bacterium]
MATARKLDLINSALAEIGEAPLTSLVSGSEDARQIAAAIYPQIVRERLSNATWRFARSTLSLSATVAGVSGQSGYDYVWALPDDILSVLKVEIDERPYDDWILHGGYLMTKAATGLVLFYQREVAEDEWPPEFERIVRLDLMVVFTRAIKEDEAAARSLEDKLLVAERVARARYGRQRSPQQPVRSPLVERRRHGKTTAL